MNNHRVALLIETSNSYARGVLRGIVSYLREHRRWSLYLGEHERGAAPPAWLKAWDGDGVIARVENRRIAEAIEQCGLPAVDVSAARLLPDVPWVETDDQTIAALAAEHFLERGFKHFAYCGDDRFNWSRWRQQHFVARLEGTGHDCAVFEPPKRGTWDVQQAHLEAWLRELPKPVGVMACYDIRGSQLLEACRAADIAVPEEVAVLGVDNDELLCNLCEPPLSSIAPNTHRTGYVAAQLLDRMLLGEETRADAHLVEPTGIVTRQSTDILAVHDADVAEALRCIRQRACEGIRVGDVLKVVPLSRRVLESRFRKILGRTPHEEIVRIRLQRVKEMLLETELALSAIAERTGFRHVEYLSSAFKKAVGQPPSVWRREQQSGEV